MMPLSDSDAGGKRRYGRSGAELAEIAVGLIEQRGFAATTVEQIAASAGYSPRTFHRQFPTKEDVVFYDFPDILQPLRALVEDPPADAWAAVGAVLIDNAVVWQTSRKDLARRRTALIFSEPAIQRRFLELAGEWEDVLARVFAAERGLDPHTDASSQVLATAVVGACRVALRLWLVMPEGSLARFMTDALNAVPFASRPGRGSFDEPLSVSDI